MVEHVWPPRCHGSGQGWELLPRIAGGISWIKQSLQQRVIQPRDSYRYKLGQRKYFKSYVSFVTYVFLCKYSLPFVPGSPKAHHGSWCWVVFEGRIIVLLYGTSISLSWSKIPRWKLSTWWGPLKRFRMTTMAPNRKAKYYWNFALEISTRPVKQASGVDLPRKTVPPKFCPWKKIRLWICCFSCCNFKPTMDLLSLIQVVGTECSFLICLGPRNSKPGPFWKSHTKRLELGEL